MLQNNTKFYLRGIISQTMTVGGTFNISNDLELQLPVDTNGETVSIVFRSERQLERMTVTISQGVCTVVSRGIEQRGGGNSSALQRTWTEGTLGYITALDIDLIDKDGATNDISANNTFTGDNNFKKITFNDTTEAGLEVNSLTTTERLVLTPVNGAIVYDETLGDFFTYKGGAWAVIDTGTSTPNMSETVNGTGEIATASERGNATSVGGTGARLLVSNDALVKTSSGASDENKVPILNDEGKVTDFVGSATETQEGLSIIASEVEAIAGLNDTKYITPLSGLSAYGNIVPGTDYTYLESTPEVTSSNLNYIKVKEFTVNSTGSFIVSFDAKLSNNTTGLYTDIRINGISVDEISISGTSYVNYSSELNIKQGDKLQLYIRSVTTSITTTIQNFKAEYSLVAGVVPGVINID